MQDTDGQLLGSFASRRDEEAFRLLAKRHLGLVFHTALRRTGNRTLAEEISQNILLAMARKAGELAKDPDRLPAWLHRATLFESTKAMRAESSYERRKQQGHDETAPDAHVPDPAWREALPHLDLALDKLPEADRRIILLHYFEGHPFPRIAERMGKNLTAVQKQSQRALEKLSRILRTRGIALSVTALGAGLATQTARAVPEALVLSASSFAIAGSSSPLAFSLTAMLASKSKVTLPLALLLLATPLVLQQLAIAGERTRIQSLRETLALSNKTASVNPRAPSHVSSTIISGRIDITALANEQLLARRSEGEPWRLFKLKLHAMETDVLVDLVRKAAAAPLGIERKSGLMEMLVAALAERDPRLAVTTAVEALPAGSVVGTIIWNAGLDCHLVEWTKKDPAAAIAWLREQENSPKLNVCKISATGLKEPSELDNLKSHLLMSLVLSDAPRSDDFLRGQSESERVQLIRNTIATISLNEMRDIMEKDWVAPYLRIVREFIPEQDQDEILGDLARTGTWKRIAPMLTAAGATPGEKETMVRSIAFGQLSQARQNRFYGRRADLDEDLLKWLEDIMPGRSQEIIADAQTAADQAASEKAADTLAKLRNNIDFREEFLSAMLTLEDLSRHLEESLELAERIKNPVLRQKTVDHLNAKAKILTQP